MKTVHHPEANEKDLVDVPEEVRKRAALVPVENMDQVLAEALIDAPRPAARIKAERDERQARVGRRPRRPRKPAEKPPIAATGEGTGSGDQPPAGQPA